MADTIATVRRRRGTVRGRLTRIERDISSLEEKETPTPSQRKRIVRLNDQVKEHDQEFEKRHMEVLDFIEEEDLVALNSEEKVFDERVIRVAGHHRKARETGGPGDYRACDTSRIWKWKCIDQVLDQSLRRNISADDWTRCMTP